MASSKAPKHDFAPAWLKIPEQESGKPPGPKSAEHNDSKMGRPGRRDDYYNAYNRYPGPPDYPYQPLQRQRSFDNYYDGQFDRRYSPQKFRHHSMDDEYYNGPYNGYPPYYNGYNYDKYAPPYRSQPSLYRDGKYQHPNARYSQGPGGAGPGPGPGPGPFHMNGGPMNGGPPYPPYYDPYYDYYHGDPYYGSYMRPPPPSKRNYSDTRERHPSKGDKDGKDKSVDKQKENIDDDFPSLNGDSGPSDTSKNPATGAWENPAKTPHKSNDDSTIHSPVDPKEGKMYKAQLPNKARNKSHDKQNEKESDKQSLLTRKLSRDNLKDSQSKDVNSNNAVKESDTSDKSSSLMGESGDLNHCGTSDTKEMDRLIKTNHDHAEETLANGFKELSVSPNENILSSSLELEERLLREMGWNEADDEEYVITEDEVKEFQNLRKSMDEKRNGFNRTLPKTWSPQHTPIFSPPTVQELIQDASSSTSDDSDSDIN